MAGSKISILFVAAITTTPVSPLNPSISVRIWFNVCSRSSFPPPILLFPERARAIESISSMKIIAGCNERAFSNNSRTRAAPTPTNNSTNCEPETFKNGTPDSPAIAFASNVFPVPGGPPNKTPFGTAAPTLLNSLGAFKNFTTSCNSDFASSFPATSSNLILMSVATEITFWSNPVKSAKGSDESEVGLYNFVERLSQVLLTAAKILSDKPASTIRNINK